MKTSEAVEEFVIEDIQQACLADVLTIHEVCQIWGKHHSTVLEQCKRKTLIARQAAAGQTWLISKMSCIQKWGQPK